MPLDCPATRSSAGPPPPCPALLDPTGYVHPLPQRPLKSTVGGTPPAGQGKHGVGHGRVFRDMHPAESVASDALNGLMQTPPGPLPAPELHQRAPPDKFSCKQPRASALARLLPGLPRQAGSGVGSSPASWAGSWAGGDRPEHPPTLQSGGKGVVAGKFAAWGRGGVGGTLCSPACSAIHAGCSAASAASVSLVCATPWR